MLAQSATWALLGKGILETLYMTLVSTLLAYILGLPMGVLLVVTDKQGIKPKPIFNGVLSVVVNIIRSAPFLILLVTLIPVTRAIIGKIIGPTAMIVPLVIGAAPFIARMVESSLKEVDYGVIEAAHSMGASPFEIIFKVMLPEAKPSLTVGAAVSIITILGYSAMAGFCGGGGLGDIAVRYGYYRNEPDLMIVTLVLIIVIVQILQEVGMRIAKRCDKRR